MKIEKCDKMINKAKKGSRKEAECLIAFKNYMLEKEKDDYQFRAEWKVQRAGGVSARFRGGNDFLNAFDIALAYNFNIHSQFNRILILYLIQVKSDYRKKEYKKMKEFWRESLNHCYMAYYGHVPKNVLESKRNGIIKIKGFTLVEL